LQLRIPLAQRADRLRAFIAKHLARYVKDRREIPRLKILPQLLDHVCEHVSRGRGHARPRRHGAAALHGVIGAKDKRHGIEQINRRLGLSGHRYRV
jgi:hypothetical protein